MTGRFVYPPAICAGCGQVSDDLYYVDPQTGRSSAVPCCRDCFERLLCLSTTPRTENGRLLCGDCYR